MQSELLLLGQVRPPGEHANEDWPPSASTSLAPRLEILSSHEVEPQLSNLLAEHDQELVVINRTVRWSASGAVKREATLPSAILQAGFCRMPIDSTGRNESLLTSLCVLTAPGGALELLGQEGVSYTIVPPCRISSFWPLPLGLLIERRLPKTAANPSSESSPTIFGVTHPLDELKPVSFLGGGFVTNPHLRIIFSSRLVPLIAAFDEKQRQIIFYAVRRRPPDPNERTYERALSVSSPLNPSAETSFSSRLKSSSHSHSGTTVTSGLGSSRKLAEEDLSAVAASSVPPVVPTVIPQEGDGNEEDDQSLFLAHSPISSELYLEQLLSLNATSPPRVFLAGGGGQSLLVCLHDEMPPGSLTAFSLVVDQSSNALQMHPSFSISDVRSVVPIGQRSPALPSPPLFAVLNASKLQLYAANQPVCDLSLPPDLSLNATVPSVATATTAPPCAVVALEHAVGERFTLTLSDNTRVRMMAAVHPTSAIVSDCMAALADTLPLSIYAALLRDTIIAATEAKHAAAGELLVDNDDTEWAVFSQLLSSGSVTKFSRKSRTDDASDDDWERLLRSDYHGNHAGDPLLVALSLSVDTPVPHVTGSLSESTPAKPMAAYNHPDCLPNIVQSLHLLYENYKLNSLNSDSLKLRPLRRLLMQLAMRLGWTEYVDHYQRDCGGYDGSVLLSTVTNTTEVPPSIFGHLLATLRGLPSNAPFPVCSPVCDWTRKICRFYAIIAGGDGSAYRPPNAAKSASTPSAADASVYPLLLGAGETAARQGSATARTAAERAVVAMVTEGVRLADLECIPLGIALPLREALRACRYRPPGDWPAAAYVLIGRDDLAAALIDNTVDSRKSPPLAAKPIHADDSDGLRFDDDVTALIFGKDKRLTEVARLLRSSVPMRLAVAQQPGMSDHDLLEAQQAKLLMLAQRQLALAVGRGMSTLALSAAAITEPVPIPPLVLAGRPLGATNTVALDMSALSTSFTAWPEFHNGVAAGLRLAPASSGIHGNVTTQWIAFNKAAAAVSISSTSDGGGADAARHAGLLMGLGLAGHLSTLALPEVFTYMSQLDEMTSVALLLGLAAAKRGSMDATVAKMLAVHIPALHPPMAADLEVAGAVQTAAVMGAGLLYLGTAHRRMVEVLLAEISRRPGDDRKFDRQAHALAAGLALGMVVLGKGNTAVGLSDLHIEDRLRKLMIGGKEATEVMHSGPVDIDDERPAVPAGWRVSVLFPPTSGNAASAGVKSTLAYEGTQINVDVTSPGATLALALMYAKTNNESVAALFAMPDTRFLLDAVRPDFLLLRTVARALVLWDSVRPTTEWIEAAVPSMVRQLANRVLALHTAESAQTAKPTPKKGKAATTGTGGDTNEDNNNTDEDDDCETAVQAYLNIVTGGCLSLGLRFAGTANQSARSTLLAMAKRLRDMRRHCHGALKKPGFDRPLLETCIDVTAMSVSMVMAGTGDLDVLRVIRGLHRRIGSDVSYGHHMAAHMALGFLCLGGGKATLGRSLVAMATLLAAVYPRFPLTTDDNRYHLQALRHLYVLAVEPRCLSTVDVDTGRPCYVPIQVSLKNTPAAGDYVGSGDNGPLSLVAPCLLPEYDTIEQVVMATDRYMPLVLDVGSNSRHYEQVTQSRVVFVKRKAGFLSYQDDPNGTRGLLARPCPTAATKGSNYLDFIQSFSADPHLLAFAEHFCTSDNTTVADDDTDEVSNDNSDAAEFNTAVLYECLTKEKSEVLPTYLSLYAMARLFTEEAGSPSAGAVTPSLVWTLRLVVAYYESSLSRGITDPLIQPEFIASLKAQVEAFFEKQQLDGALKAYIESGQIMGNAQLESARRKALFAAYLSYYEIPSHGQLTKLQEVLRTSAGVNHPGKLLPTLAAAVRASPVALLKLASVFVQARN